MTTREEMSQRYSDMTSSVAQLNDTARAQLRATRVGNAIATTAAIVNHRDQQITHSLLKESIEVQARQTKAIVGELRTIDTSINSFALTTKSQLDDIKHITFAQWRDGVGREYYYGYRPKALEYLKNYEEISNKWLQVVSARMYDIVRDFPSWKRPWWRADALSTGVFIDPPEPLPFPEQKPLPRRWIPDGFMGLALMFGGFAVAAMIIPFIMSLVISAIALAMTVGYESEFASRNSAIEKEFPEFVQAWEDLSPTAESIPEIREILDAGCDKDVMQSDIARAQKSGSELNMAAFPQDAAGVARYCSARTDSLEMYRDYAIDSQKNEERITAIGEALAVLMILLSFCVPALMWLMRTRARKKAEAIEQLNAQNALEWNRTLEQRKAEFVHRNGQARDEAFELFQQILGLRLNEKLGTYWASLETRNVARILIATIDNELSRPPVVKDLPELGPMRLNSQAPEALRTALLSES